MNMKCGIKCISDTLIADKKKLSFLKQREIKKQWRGSVSCLLNAHSDFNIQGKKKNKKQQKSRYRYVF